jgi:hypothetical protein
MPGGHLCSGQGADLCLPGSVHRSTGSGVSGGAKTKGCALRRPQQSPRQSAQGHRLPNRSGPRKRWAGAKSDKVATLTGSTFEAEVLTRDKRP